MSIIALHFTVGRYMGTSKVGYLSSRQALLYVPKCSLPTTDTYNRNLTVVYMYLLTANLVIRVVDNISPKIYSIILNVP